MTRDDGKQESLQRACPLCRAQLEPAGKCWICSSCLVRWRGDTFEALDEDMPDLPPYLGFRFGI